MAAASADPHPHAELDRLEAGTASERDFEVVVRHLLAGCDPCGERLAELWGVGPTDRAALARAVDHSIATFGEARRRADAERAAADELVTQLRDLPDPRRRLLLRNIQRARRRAVCERLIEESRAWRHESAAETLRFAELAVLVAERLGDQAGELRARAYAERGNARRISGDLAAAERDLIQADKILAVECADPLVQAEMLSLRASLAWHRGRFDEAIQLLLRAASRYSRYGDLSGLAKVLIKLGHVHAQRGTPEKGITPVTKALKLLGPTEMELKLSGLSVLLHLLTEAGETREAAGLVRRTRILFELHASKLDRLRFDWTSARIERDLGNYEPAIQELKRIRQCFLAEELPHDVALASLDLALAYAKIGRRTELRILAAETSQLFSHIGIDREYIAAVRLFSHVSGSDAMELATTLSAAVERARLRERSTKSG